MPDAGSNTLCAVILTAIPVEYQAVRAHLTGIYEEVDPLIGIIYERGIFSNQERLWNVGIVEVGAGIADAALAADRAINYFDPILILFVGIAGGLKDVVIGDIVAATKVYGYASGKAREAFETRPDVSISTFRMEQRAKAEARRSDWLKRLTGSLPDPLPRVFVAPIASGDQVVASTDSALYQFLRTSYSDALAVEMEGHGFLHAARAHPQVNALVIRGISDLIDSKSEADAENFQAIAARHASAFAFEVLGKLDVADLQQGSRLVKASIASKGHELREQMEHKIDEQGELQTTSSTSFTDTLLQEFRIAVPEYITEIELARDLFGSEQDVYRDQCDSAIEALNRLDEHVQKLNRDATGLDLVLRLELANIRDQIRGLKPLLQRLRQYQPTKARMQRRQRDNDLNKVSTNFDFLLERLERLIPKNQA